jgi:predicted Zn-dependent protease
MRAAPTPPPAPAQSGAGGDRPSAPPRPLTKLERLRQRMPRLPESVLVERRRRAKEFFDAARLSESRGSFVEAAQGVRLAIAFDPFNEDYKRAFGDVQAKATEQRAERLLEETEGLDSSQMRQALRMLEDVLLYRPHDPKVNDRAAGVALELDMVEKAREYAQRSVEHSPDVAAYRKTLAKVHLAAREKGHAVHELEKAQKLDPADPWIRRVLTSLKSHPARAGGGIQ